MVSHNKLSLSRKAILLVTVPVVFQIVLFACLSFLLLKIDAERAGEEHSRKLVTHLSQMLASHFQRISLLFMSRMTGDDKYGSQANQIKTGVRDQIAIVEKLVSTDKKESAAWRTIKADEEALNLPRKPEISGLGAPSWTNPLEMFPHSNDPKIDMVLM